MVTATNSCGDHAIHLPAVFRLVVFSSGYKLVVQNFPVLKLNQKNRARHTLETIFVTRPQRHCFRLSLPMPIGPLMQTALFHNRCGLTELLPNLSDGGLSFDDRTDKSSINQSSISAWFMRNNRTYDGGC